MGTKWNKTEAFSTKSHEDSMSLVEGFNMFGTDYFKNVKRKITIPGLSDLIEEIMKYLKQFGNPITGIDKAIENSIKELLILLVGQVNCNTGGLKNSRLLDNTLNGFTWASGQLNVLESSKAVKTVTTVIQGAQDANYAKKITDNLPNIENFSMQELPDLEKTIQSFMETHPKIENKTALSTLYITQLNKYEKSIGGKPTTEQLFIFNNEFDDQLNNVDMIDKIKTIAVGLPKPSYPNTSKGFEDFLSERGQFYFTHPINGSLNANQYAYYPLNIQYFPYPKDLTGFAEVFDNIDAPDFLSKLNSFLISINTPEPTPPIPSISTPVDLNYAYSVNLSATQTNSMLSYLDYVTQFFSFIVYKNQSAGSSIAYPIIQSKVFVIYTEYLNALEFQKYRVYSTFLTPHEVAMFNHLFFIAIQQNYTNANIYNLAISPMGDLTSGLLGPAASLYINLLPQTVFQLMSTITSQINIRLPYLSSEIVTKDYQPLPMDGVLVIPPIPEEYETGGPLLYEYILGIPSDEVVVPIVDVPPAIVDYYVPAGLIECEQENQNIKNECGHYARTIKNEIYRLFVIPIILYITYNAYYIFFFKDCLSLPKETDSTGKNYFRHTCSPEANGSGGPLTPIFPDWELSFHSMEKHKTDYFFEFLFKPLKIFYTLLNTIKTFFRKSIDGTAIKDKVPYIFFLVTFVYIYGFIQSNSKQIIETLYSLAQFNTPDMELSKGLFLSSIAQGIIVIYFAFSFLDKFAGIRIFSDDESTQGGGDEGQEQGDEEKEDEQDEEKEEQQEKEAKISGGAEGDDAEGDDDGEKENKGDNAKTTASRFKEGIKNGFNKLRSLSSKTWISWLFIPSGALMTVIKWISAILYWIFKYIISVGLTTLSMYIVVFYFAYMFLFGASYYTTPTQGANDKIDLMFRVMYTKLCDTKNDTILKYVVKTVFFFCIYFLVEGVIIHNLLKGMNNFKNMTTPSPIHSSPLKKTNDKINSNNLAVKSGMIILYGLIIAVVALWCAYKFMYRMPTLVQSYKPGASELVNKTFVFDNKTDDYETQSQNKMWKVLIKSDSLNQAHIDDFTKKTAGMEPPTSFISGFISTIGDYSDKFTDTLNSVSSKLGEYKDSMKNGFGSMATSAKSGLSSMASSAKSGLASAKSGVNSVKSFGKNSIVSAKSFVENPIGKFISPK